MMLDFAVVFNSVVDILKIEFEIYGFHISFWNLGVYGFVSSVFGWVVWEVLNRD